MFAEWPQSRGWALQTLAVVPTVWECHGESARNCAINHHGGRNMWFVVRKKRAKLLDCKGENDTEQEVRFNKKQVGALRTRGSRRTEASTSGFVDGSEM